MKGAAINYHSLLQQYQLEVDFIEDYGKVKKVYTKNGVYALKQVEHEEIRNYGFIQTLQVLQQKGWMGFVPIYQTKHRQPIVTDQKNAYYLMPWLPNNPTDERDIRYHKLFQELAKLHGASVREVDVKEEDIEQHYSTIKKTWEDRQEELEQYVIECEKKVYMSPFELHFCTFYYEMTRALEFGFGKLDDWNTEMEEKEKIRLVTVHGKLSAKHFVYDERGNGFFINFEQAKDASPIYDLVSFYFRTLRTYPVTSFDSYEWFATYEKHFALKEEERLLLHSYLAFPEPLYQCVVQYRQNHSSRTELEHMQSLIRAYWLTKNIEQLNIKIFEVDQQRKIAAEAAAQAQANE
ncbi:spore coat protein YsxE [Priestia megaterium]|nr:spore coat protein YsxE [Priestia megaterium]